MLRALASAFRLWWWGAAGHRLRPWQSPYLRWRVETYSGKPAATLRLRDFLSLIFAERRQMLHFLLWSGEMAELASAPGKRS